MSDLLPDEIDSRFFEHGGRIDAASELYPAAPRPWLDLSTGISPWSYPAPSPNSDDWRALPDAALLHRLALAARKTYRAPASADVVALPGTDLGLSVIPWLFRTPKKVAILGPSYSGHAKAWKSAGHTVSTIASLDQLGGAAILIVVNPNNPDGRVIAHADLAATIPALKKRDGLLIVDEAFADAADGTSILPAVAKLDMTLVLRSVGKFYGAGGLRLGFALTSHPIAARLRDALGAWPVAAPALAFGLAALSDAEWAEGQRQRLAQAVAQLDAILTAAGLRVMGGTALFRLALDRRSRELFTHLAENGILTRPFKDRDALRFGLPANGPEQERLQAALISAPRQTPAPS